MKGKAKGIWAAAILLLTILATAAAIQIFSFRPEPYNKNPDLSQKKMSSYLIMAERSIPFTLEMLTMHADVILIGEVLADDQYGSFSMYGDDPVWDKKVENLNLNVMTSCTYAEIKIERILAGDAPPEDTFALFQVGAGDAGQPKVHTGERVLLILKKFENGTYKCYDEASSVFYLDEQDKMLSMSSDMICARYDGLSLDTFVYDLKHSYFYSVIGKSEEEREARLKAFTEDTDFKRKRLLEWKDLTGEDLLYLIGE